jgi:hypothetical protein
MDEYYDRDFADPHQLPPEPIGWWGLSGSPRPWGRYEDRWGTDEDRRGPDDDRWGSDDDRWGSDDDRWSSDEDRWGTSGRMRERGMVRRGRGTGAWGPGQAEPGLWEPERRPVRRTWYGRDFPASDRRARAGDGIEWNGWGYQVSRGRGPGEHSRQRRAFPGEWGRYRASGGGEWPSGAWDYGRHREHLFEAGDEGAPRGRGGWRRVRYGRPDLREGEAWNEFGPGRWPRERRLRERDLDYDRDYGPPRRAGRGRPEHGW